VELVRDRLQRLPAKEETHRLVNLLREQHVLLSATGLHGNVLKLRPPLVFSKEHADLLLDTTAQALQRL
ncbi:MAG: aspartate aminotransferase family protein, partial [Acidovorax sp.]|jgi:4-aminobutyrate aminotransferase-like enzyme|nr:aspartate aminotransferase family protein [Acidovorax sp.]